MAYKVYEAAKHLNCSEDKLIEFLETLGFNYVFRLSVIREDAYDKAREYFSKPKYRVFDMAKEFNRDEQVIIDFLNKRRIKVKNRFSGVDAKAYELVKTNFAHRKSVEYAPSPPVSKPALPANFDYHPLLKKFDVAALEKSAIKYFDAVLSVTNELLKILQEYEKAQAETIAQSLKMTFKLNAKFTDNPLLTPEENSLLAAVTSGTRTYAPKKKILFVKAQTEKFSERLEKICDSENYSAFFAAHKNLVASVVN